MAINEFLTFAGDPAANVMTQAQYSDAGFTARVLGFASGTAVSAELNKAWRQASIIGHMIGQFTADYSGQDAKDDGTTSGITALENSFALAVHAVALGAVGTGYLPLIGGTLTGDLKINSINLSISAPTNNNAQVNLSRDAGSFALINAQTKDLSRWQIRVANGDSEQGSDSGSNFAIASYHDGGQAFEVPLAINRATGVVNFAHTPQIGGLAFPFVKLAGGDSMAGTLGIGGNGVFFPGLAGNAYNNFKLAFGWDGTNIVVSVDGVAKGQLATVGGLGQSGASYVLKVGDTMTGALTVTGAGISVSGASTFGNSVAFGGAGDFENYVTGLNSRSRLRQWATNWYDSFDASTSQRAWVGSVLNVSTQLMTLDNVGNFLATGTGTFMGGKVISRGNTNPTIVSHNTGVTGVPPGSGVATGFWSDAQGMWLGNLTKDGNPLNNNPASGHLQILSNGQVNVVSDLTVGGNLSVTGNIGAQGYFFTWKDTQGRAAEGAIYGQGVDIGVWRIIGPNDPTRSQQLSVKYKGGPLIYNTPSYADPAGSGAWYCDINGNTIQQGNSNAAAFIVTSDEGLKEDFRPWNVGLDAVLAIQPISFLFTDASGIGAHQRRRFFGTTAQRMLRALPEAVVTQKLFVGPDLTEDLLAVEPFTILYAAVNAIHELEARLRAAETMIKHLHQTATERTPDDDAPETA